MILKYTKFSQFKYEKNLDHFFRNPLWIDKFKYFLKNKQKTQNYENK